MNKFNQKIFKQINDLSRRVTVLWLRHCGLSYNEICSKMGISQKSIWLHITNNAGFSQNAKKAMKIARIKII